MPGKRYRYQLTAAPFKGRRARIVGSSSFAGQVLVEVQHTGDKLSWPMHAMQEIRQKSTNPKKARTSRDRAKAKKHRPLTAPKATNKRQEARNRANRRPQKSR